MNDSHVPWKWTRRFAVGLTLSVAAFSAWGALAPHIAMAGWVAPTAAGVLMPSVDGVGRYFPLTLACVLDDAPAPLLLRTERAWFERAEALALAALAEASSFEKFENVE